MSNRDPAVKCRVFLFEANQKIRQQAGIDVVRRLKSLKLYIVAAAIALVSMPWIAEQLDG